MDGELAGRNARGQLRLTPLLLLKGRVGVGPAAGIATTRGGAAEERTTAGGGGGGGGSRRETELSRDGTGAGAEEAERGSGRDAGAARGGGHGGRRRRRRRGGEAVVR